jgi:hypothetical protein
MNEWKRNYRGKIHGVLTTIKLAITNELLQQQESFFFRKIFNFLILILIKFRGATWAFTS